MANRLQVVTSRLLYSLVCCDGGISGGSSQVLSLLEWDVFSLAILVAFGKTEINNVDVVSGSVSATNEEVIRLNITMDDSFFVNFFDEIVLESRILDLQGRGIGSGILLLTAMVANDF